MAAAVSEIHKSGFQAAGVNEILDVADVTKGALYHHFESKSKLGYAVVEEEVREMIHALWVEPLTRGEDVIDTLIETIRGTEHMTDKRSLLNGCMLLNISQEMSPLDEGFRTRTKSIFDEWRSAISSLLARGQKQNLVRDDINPSNVAAFVVASHEGALSLAKNGQDIKLLVACHDQLCLFLESLRKI